MSERLIFQLKRSKKDPHGSFTMSHLPVSFMSSREQCIVMCYWGIPYKNIHLQMGSREMSRQERLTRRSPRGSGQSWGGCGGHEGGWRLGVKRRGVSGSPSAKRHLTMKTHKKNQKMRKLTFIHVPTESGSNAALPPGGSSDSPTGSLYGVIRHLWRVKINLRTWNNETHS